MNKPSNTTSVFHWQSRREASSRSSKTVIRREVSSEGGRNRCTWLILPWGMAAGSRPRSWVNTGGKRRCWFDANGSEGRALDWITPGRSRDYRLRGDFLRDSAEVPHFIENWTVWNRVKLRNLSQQLPEGPLLSNYQDRTVESAPIVQPASEKKPSLRRGVNAKLSEVVNLPEQRKGGLLG